MSQHENHGSGKSYVIGFILSIVLTIIPLLLVLNHILNKGILIFSILAMAVLQLFVQLFFFMHVKDGEKPHYHTMALILGAIIVFTIVGGSIWIMSFNSQVH
ncbi:cytochrome o ubiquinol oxidase subunit IV [Ectobacillus panaciterrae]|uniref:cytochrome o ubiquinol oxidase subunit IV n=1 Tax=Ectobacillus panaciterrae TaxID=363872 RepID=UPI00040A4606|nr:cytochrome o ubiquinol oxidase subunit IV [Ectobacillus panaciterrae]